VGLLDWIKNLLRARPPARARPTDLHDTAEYSPVSSVPLASGKVLLRAGVYTTVGNYREHNEDNFYVPGIASLRPRETVERHPSAGLDPFGSGLRPTTGLSSGPAGPAVLGPATSNGPAGLFVVADGMGGQMAGERASQMAVDIIPTELSKRLGAAPEGLEDRDVRAAIREAVARSNDEILAQSHLDSECNSMGTTVVLVFFHKDRAYVAGIGDSRAYRLRDGRFELFTEDHSLAEALRKAGTIKDEEVESHKFKHVLYLYLGSRDVGSGPEEVKSLDVRLGDRFLLATDGLTGVVSDEQMANILAGHGDPQKAAEALGQLAIESQSKDNITCVVVHVLSADS
jgi:protein phosphatase